MQGSCRLRHLACGVPVAVVATILLLARPLAASLVLHMSQALLTTQPRLGLDR